ncbi:MAG: hypothetical protein B6D61_13265 [Bacteroidetes bacterium 4484_249]|nr:MAG: hypothetical protein B6D61_13265 [Bacteroidetes bacterium 4484_249]
MELENLLFDSSHRTAEMAVIAIGDNPELFNKILNFAFNDNGKFAMRAARVIQMSAICYPELVQPHLKNIIQQMSGFKTAGLKRSFAKIIAEMTWDFDEEILGILADTCFKWLNNSSEKIALKIYSQDILYKISQLYPDLKHELISTLENQLPHSSIAIRTRSRKMIKKLYKEVQEI